LRKAASLSLCEKLRSLDHIAPQHVIRRPDCLAFSINERGIKLFLAHVLLAGLSPRLIALSLPVEVALSRALNLDL
jgi:hypothetical protein